MVLVGAAQDARPVAAVMRGFDLDHVRAVLGQHHGAGRAGDPAAQIDHLHAGEGRVVVHGSSPKVTSFRP